MNYIHHQICYWHL